MLSLRALFAGSCALLVVRADYIRTTVYSSTDCGQGGDAPVQTTVTNFACTGTTNISCTNSTAYIMNSFTGANCTGNIINPDSNVVPGNGRCIAGAGPTVVNYQRVECVTGQYSPASRTGVRLDAYAAPPPSNDTCAAAVSGKTPLTYYDIAPACQRYNTGTDDESGRYLSYQISCVNGNVRAVYYTGNDCRGSTDPYNDQVCDKTPTNLFLWSCTSPAAAASNTGAIVGGVLGGLAFIAIVATVFAVPGLRANIFHVFSSAKASASAAVAGGSTYEALPLKGTA